MKVTRFIIHCTATPAGRDVSARQIDAWHRARGFRCIGYHYVVLLDGTIVKGRDENQPGAHCKGQNSCSLGIVYVGGVLVDGKTPADTRTPAQRKALLELLRKLKTRYPGATIHGHREFAAKACPCFDAAGEYASLECDR